MALARQFGAEVVVNPAAGEDVLAVGQAFSRGRGVDAVLVTASTQSSEPVIGMEWALGFALHTRGGWSWG